MILNKFFSYAALFAVSIASASPENSCENNPDPFVVSGRKTDTCENLARNGRISRDKKCDTNSKYFRNCPGICDKDNCGSSSSTSPVVPRESITVGGDKKAPGASARDRELDELIRQKARTTQVRMVHRRVAENHSRKLMKNQKKDKKKKNSKKKSNRQPSPPTSPTPTPTPVPTDAPTSSSILSNWDLEEETLSPWEPRGGATVRKSQEHAYSGNFGALVTERSANWDGLYQEIHDILQPGVIYEFSAWVRLVDVPEDYSERFQFKVHERYASTVDGLLVDESKITVAVEEELTSEWTKVTGLYQFDIGEGRELISQELYAFGRGSMTASFAIDEIAMWNAMPVTADIFVDASQNTERVVIPQPPPVDLATARIDCPHIATSNLISWESLYPTLSSGTNLELPENTSVLINDSIETQMGIVTIPETSALIFGENPNGIAIDVAGIKVEGSLIAGSDTCRYETPLTITLHGSRPAVNKDPSYKGISVTGRIDLHGKRYYRTWTRLARRAHKGDTSLYLQNNVNWESGQQIVLLTTALRDSRDWHQNEVLTIQSVQISNIPHPAVKAIVTLTSPVQYHHIARSEYQAEVGLLTRTIKIQGSESDSEPTDLPTGTCDLVNYDDGAIESIFGHDQISCPDKYLTGFGGHVMVHSNGAGYVEGIELYRMGQTNVLGRYPMHFHLLQNNCPGCYFKDSSVHRSFYRCISVHGTNNIMVSENVAFDVTGYCYYLEDGIEEQNTFSYNLAAHIHVLGYPAIGGPQNVNLVRESPNLILPADITASGFYITNLQNIVIGNVAVGGWAGFAMPNLHEAIGPHRNENFSPRKRTVLEFDGNTAHSTAHFWHSAAAFYFGGSLYYDGDELVYNAGRDKDAKDRKIPCIDDEDGNCQEAWNRITNTKVFLTAQVGIGTWSGRMEVLDFECHDCGLAAEALVAGFWMDNALVTCRTGEALLMPTERADLIRADGFFWYDTNQEHIITSSTFRNCGYRSVLYDQYSTSETRGCGDNPYNGCRSSSTVYGFLTHSDEHNPELMQATRNLTFDNIGRKFMFKVIDLETTSGRTQNWLDVDGTVSGFGEPTIIGSGLASAGLWWRVDDDVFMDDQGPVSFIKQNAGPARGLGHIRLGWDTALHDTVGGDDTCRNGGSGLTEDCPAVGRIRHLGSRFNSTNDPEGGFPITLQPDIVGLTGGFGWLLSLDGGAPHTLEISQVEVLPNTPLLLSVAYPLGTSFTIKAIAASWCSASCTKRCEELFTAVDTVQEVRYSEGNVYHFDDETGLLTIRVIMFPDAHTGEPSWKLYNFDDVDSGGDYELDRFERDGVLLPRKTHEAYIKIVADCPRNGAFCATAPPISSAYDDVCGPGFTQVSYDRCCDAFNNCQDLGLLVPTMAPTLSPAPTTRIRNPELVENGDFESGVVCPWQAVACDLAVVSGAMSVIERTKTWAGPRLDLTNRIEVGSSYYFHAEIRFPNADVENMIAVKIVVEYNNSSLESSYLLVAENDSIPNNQKTTLTARFDLDATKLSSLDVDSYVLYFETPPQNGQSPTWDFEADNISMMKE